LLESGRAAGTAEFGAGAFALAAFFDAFSFFTFVVTVLVAFVLGAFDGLFFVGLFDGFGQHLAVGFTTVMSGERLQRLFFKLLECGDVVVMLTDVGQIGFLFLDDLLLKGAMRRGGESRFMVRRRRFFVRRRDGRRLDMLFRNIVHFGNRLGDGRRRFFGRDFGARGLFAAENRGDVHLIETFLLFRLDLRFGIAIGLEARLAIDRSFCL